MANPVPFNSAHADSGSLNTLLKVSRQVVETLDLQQILQSTVDGAASLFNWGTAAIYLMDEQTENGLVLHATFPPLPPNFPDQLRRLHLSNHPHLHQAIQTQKPVTLPDAATATLTEEEKLAAEQRGLRTVYYVPLLAANDVLGAFIIATTEAVGTITTQEADMATTLANFAALAIKNARLYDDRQSYIQQLENTISERDAEKDKKEKLEDELFHAQRLDAIGQLAGGIAHDFNNQLSGILGYAELLKYKTTEPKLGKYASRIATLAQRSADLNTKLLAFSRKGGRKSEDVDIHGVIDEVCDMLSHTISREIQIQKSLAAKNHTVFGDPTQIQSALLNLGINARDAMPEGGALRFESAMVQLTNPQNEVGPFLLEAGEYIRVSVSDSGTGMDEATMQRMYEPFFTTKQAGKGTGMGLSAVFGTMKMYNGGIDVVSEQDAGTTFHLFFPAQLQHTAFEGDMEEIAVTNTPAKEVLIIDDEATVCEVFGEYMRTAGYQPHCFTDPHQALTYYRNAHESISLVLLDMIMPQLNGSDVFRLIREISPRADVILVSGYAEDSSIQPLLNAGARAFIQKPFRGTTLIKTVRELIPSPETVAN